jgi:hypothetical protein
MNQMRHQEEVRFKPFIPDPDQEAWIIRATVLALVFVPWLCAGFALIFVGAGIFEAMMKVRGIKQRKAKGKYLEKLRAQSKERHRIKKLPITKPCPSPEAVSAQWDRSRDSLREMVNFGLLLYDVEPHVDNSLIFEKDIYGKLVIRNGRPVILGRNPGLKGWLAEHCPHIGYANAMRYKSLAMKAMKSKKSKKFIERNGTIFELQEALYKDLGIVHYKHEGVYRKRREKQSHEEWRPGQGDTPYQSLIFDVRERMRETLGLPFALPHSREARRLATAFMALTNEISGN